MSKPVSVQIRVNVPRCFSLAGSLSLKYRSAGVVKKWTTSSYCAGMMPTTASLVPILHFGVIK